jgi:sulfur carrier protein
MKKIKKIKIKLNGKNKRIDDDFSLNQLVNNLNIPIKKVAIEFNKEIIDKKDIKKIKLKNNDVIEIVHFIGGG